MDIRLPNGKLIRNVPEGTSKEEVKRKAIVAGLITAEEFPKEDEKKEDKKKPSKSKVVTEETKVIKQVQSTIQSVQIKKNAFSNFEHVETGLVFDRITQKVIGKQNKNGKIDPLTDDDIEVCNKFKFRYDVPENLNSNSKNAVAIEGLDDDEDTEAGDIVNEAEDLIEEEEEEIVEDDGGEEFFEEED